ncbi:Rpn family recombination-promoting nuclease/putative transposase [Rickettsia amblyommatis]|uniref:Putative permease n=1 Tax=Rickettsia amblyommatis str. Ac/Pa TaxID=1359164 RepID=A0A0F3N3E5_RICAM|nr:Rpn family recombination-promoting nuclease/putative transposase [Rickettsia amblyommatis]KJV62598.1 putative permease [Rickettsia amblyommatis str. Ac/Pa]
MAKKLKHDALVKKILTEKIAAQEFLEHYLPSDFKELIDLREITVEKESFVEDELKRKYSDIIYSVKTRDQEKAFVYVLIEAQSSCDYWIALRLWKYMLLLCERHENNKNKLPLICPLLIYNGSEVYNAPRNFWELFTKPERAKKLMVQDYQLVDLQNQSDDEIEQKKHLGMMEYFLKHIHQRDMLKLWDEFLIRFKPSIIMDKESGYIYLRSFLWYTDAKISEEKQQELEQIIVKHLSTEEKDNIMRTIAQKYIDEGVQHGIIQGIQQGIEKGKAEGKAEENIRVKTEIARKMLSQGCDFSLIASVTGLEEAFIRSLS